MPVSENATRTNDIPMEIAKGGEVEKPRPFVTTELAIAKTFSPASIFTSSMADFLASEFLSLLPQQKEIRGVYWDHEEGTVRIWTVIDEPNISLEAGISDAQLKFMDKHKSLIYDFSVIYLFGKPIESVIPSEAKMVARG